LRKALWSLHVDIAVHVAIQIGVRYIDRPEVKVMKCCQSQYDVKGRKAHSGRKDLEILIAWTLGESLSDKMTLVMLERAISVIFLGKHPSGTNDRPVLGVRHQNPSIVRLVSVQFNQSSLPPLWSFVPVEGVCK
jgi:hypothetical protein